MTSTHDIVLLGANMGGVPMAHYLLKHTIPKLNAIDSSKNYRLTIVSPNSDYYWKIAAPRAIIDAKQMPTKEIIKPISDLLKDYPTSSWQHILGKATAVEPSSQTVNITTNEGQAQTITYNSLILATGTHYESPLFTTEYGSEALKAALDRMHTTLPAAKSMIIAGGGPVGVETAGELAVAYPKASITLYSGAERLIARNVPPKVSAEAEKQLKALGVKIIHKVRVLDGPRGSTEAATLAFDDGSTQTADAYINAVGAGQNAGYLPESWLTNGRVAADKDTLRAIGAGADNIYALGDVNANSNGQSVFAVDGVRALASSLAVDALKGMNSDEKAAAIQAASPQQKQGLLAWLLSLFGLGGKKQGTGVGTTQQKFKTMEGMQVVPIGKSGTGILMGMQLPGFFVHQVKGKHYLTNFMAPQLNGEAMLKE